MTDTEIKTLSKFVLRQELMKAVEENSRLNLELNELQTKLQNREINIENAGSIAEASIAVNNVFQQAQKAAEQYLDNIKRKSREAEDKAELIIAEAKEKALIIEKEAADKAEKKIADAEEKVAAAKAQCIAMVAEAKRNTDARWANLQTRLDEYCAAHKGLKEELGNLKLR